MSTHRVETDDGSIITFTCRHPGMVSGDVITITGDTVPNTNRKWWQFWKPRNVLRKWVVK